MTKSYEIQSYMWHIDRAKAVLTIDLILLAMLPLCHVLGSTPLRDSKRDSIIANTTQKKHCFWTRFGVGKATGLIIVIWIWTWRLPSCWSSRVWEHIQGPRGFFAFSLQICLWPVGIFQHLRGRGQGHLIWRARTGMHIKNTGCQRLLWPLSCSLLMEESFLALLPENIVLLNATYLCLSLGANTGLVNKI